MHSGRISQCYITKLEIRLSQNPRMHIHHRKKQLSRESHPGNLDNLHGRSAPRPLRHAAKDIVKWAHFYLMHFPVKFCRLTLFEAGEAVFILLPPLFLSTLSR